MSASGTRVSVGRLRVDAARAVDKLREYQLPDPVAWVLEVVRAAIAFGATEVRVTGDADDVRVAWDGAAPSPEMLTRLFDELVDPAPRAERRAARLLATGVNTALGLGPRWIDVVVTDGQGTANEVRYTPSLLETEGGASEGLRGLTADEVMPPPEAPERGGLVHLKRLPLWDAVPLMVGYGEPRELSIVRKTCDDAKVPIFVGGTELGIGRSHGDLLRLRLGDGLDGFLALVDPSVATDAARLDVAELGVVMARYSLPLPGLGEPRGRIPVRLFVDAARMPSNASRSAVRLDESPVREAIAKSEERFVELVELLARELGQGATHDWTPSQRERLRASALVLLAAHCAGQTWRARVLGGPGAPPPPSATAPLLELPLLRDALGRPRSARSFGLVRGVEWVHFGADPLPRELEPWLGDSLWVPPGDPAMALLGAWVPPKAITLARRARWHRGRRATFLGQRKQKARLRRWSDLLVVVPLAAPGKSLKSCVPPELFDVEGLEGEVGLVSPQGKSGGVALLLEGRDIARWIPEVGNRIAGVATCAGLTPKVDYSGLVDDARLTALVRAVRAGHVVACESLALAWTGVKKQGDRARAKAEWVPGATGKDAERVASVLRVGALSAFALLAQESPSVDAQERRDHARRTLIGSKSPLATIPIWPCVGGGWVPTRELLKQGTVPPYAIGYFIGRAAGEYAPQARPVYELSPYEQGDLAAHLPEARMISYGPALVRPMARPAAGDLARLVTPPFGAALELQTKGLRAAIAMGTTHGRLEVRHWGKTLARLNVDEARVPVHVVVEDANIVPTGDFRGVADELPPYPIDEWLLTLAKAYCDALAGNRPAALVTGTPTPLEASAARAALAELIGALDDPEASLGKKRLERLRKVPFVKCLGLGALVSLAEIDKSFEQGPIAWVPVSEAPAVDLGGWHPICATLPVAQGCAKILGRGLVHGEERLAGLRKVARREQALAAHRALPASDPTSHWSGTVVEIEGRGLVRAAATLGGSSPGARVIVHIESRPFRQITVGSLPLDLYVDLPSSAVDDDFGDLNEVGHQRIGYALSAGARQLLTNVARDAPHSLTMAPEVAQLLAVWCEQLRASSFGNAHDAKARETIASAAAFPTIQGGYVAIAEAATENDTLRVALFEEAWLGPGDAERPSAYDAPVLSLLSGADAYRAVLETLWSGGPVRDASNAVARLQASRRVARGLVRAARLIGVLDHRFRYEISDVLDESDAAQAAALETLGVGEVALADRAGSKVNIFVQGRHEQSIELALIPSVEIATHSPLLVAGQMATEAVRQSFAEAAMQLIGRVVRRAVDETPPGELPHWVRGQLRTSSLSGGKLYFERLATTPMFQTSTGSWVTPADIQSQVELHEAVWTTTIPTECAPLDATRFALRLTKAEAKRLAGWAPTFDADEELRLDQNARRNMARPPVESLDASVGETMSALAVFPLEATAAEPSHGTIVVLRPGSVIGAALHVSRSFAPLGTLDSPHQWPTVARVDDPLLVPNRDWSAPEPDGALAVLRARVRVAVDQKLNEIVPYPSQRVVALRLRSAFGLEKGLLRGAALESVVYLEDGLEQGAFRLVDPRGEVSLVATDAKHRELPVHGTIYSSEFVDHRTFQAFCEAAYGKLLDRVAELLAGKTAKNADVALLHLLTGLKRGAKVSRKRLAKVTLEMIVHPEPRSLDEVSKHVDEGGFIVVCSPEELDHAKAAELDAPVLVDDGSAATRAVLEWLGARAIELGQYRWARGVDGAAMQEAAGAPTDLGAAPEAPRNKRMSPLQKALLVRWNALSAPDAVDVQIDGRRTRPIARWETGGTIVLAGRHPAVKAAQNALTTDPDHDSGVTLLVARVLGSLRRDGGRITAHEEDGLMHELMLSSRS